MLKTFVSCFFVLISGAAAVLLVACSSEPDRTDVSKQVVEAVAEDSLVITQVAEDSITALELLTSRHETQLHNTAMGTFVTAINGHEAGHDAFWVYSVNGDLPDLAADKQIVEPGDTVRWHFRIAE